MNKNKMQSRGKEKEEINVENCGFRSVPRILNKTFDGRKFWDLSTF